MNAIVRKFQVQNITANNQGMFAQLDIQRGELILTEPALVDMLVGPEDCYNPGEFFDPTSEYTGNTVVNTKVAKLTAEQRNAFRQLSTTNQNFGDLGILSTNAFQRTLEMDDVEHCTLYICAEISRINHSCKPNAVVDWNPNIDRAVLHALESIRAGDQITVCYMPNIDDFLSRRLFRRQVLQRDYGFQCNCRVCDVTPVACGRDDLLRRNTTGLRQQILNMQHPPYPVNFNIHANHPHANLQIHKDYIANLKSLGGLDGKLVEAYELLSKFYKRCYDIADDFGVRRACLVQLAPAGGGPVCGFPEHKGAILQAAMDAMDEAVKYSCRCGGADHPDVNRRMEKLRELKAERAGLPTSPR